MLVNKERILFKNFTVRYISTTGMYDVMKQNWVLKHD